jgi:hypothetical protein
MDRGVLIMAQMLRQVQFHYYNEENRSDILDSLLASVTDLNLEQYYDDLGFILHELLENVNKANLKRIYFQKNGYDINDPGIYSKAMESFKENVFTERSEYMQMTVEYGYKVQLDYLKENENLVIQITGNHGILPIEKERIAAKTALAKKYSTMEEVVTNCYDTIEGGGLGLVFTLFVLRKYGLDESRLTIESDNSKTVTRLSFPINLIESQQAEIISEIVADEIKELPQIKSHIMNIISKIDDPSANFDTISEMIKEDASLIAELIKVANSSVYILPKKITTIEEAVRLLGVKSIRNLIITLTTSNILKNKYKEQSIVNIMKHSSEVAFFAHELASQMQTRDIADNVFIGAMLHDIGKIIIESIDQEMYEKIEEISRSRKINHKAIESLGTTINHS